MIVRVSPSTVKGNIYAPASKSSMQRACAAALLKVGTTIIKNPGKSNDDVAAIDTIQKLGATISYTEKGELIVESKGIAPISGEMNCGESGLGIRMFTPIAALSKQAITITGTGSLLTRPMHFFDEIFPSVSVQIKSYEGKLPLYIQGPLIPANIEIDGSLSSQFLTGLLMAYAAAGADGVSIRVNDLKSKPYIDLTLKVLADFGWKVTHDNYQAFKFHPTLIRPAEGGEEPSPLSPIHHTYAVEGDWSGAAFLLVAGAIAGDITVEGLDVFSTQADKAILKALSDAGAGLSVQEKQIEIRNLPLKAFHFNATDCPDLFPPLVALAACCEGTTAIEGVNRLEHKESNRGLTLQEEFAKMGIEIVLQGDLMLVKGGNIKGAKVHSRHDHRIAMACAVAGLCASGEVEIEEAEAVNKSYPNFYEHLKLLGTTLTPNS
jgi:3-phosphoshikimate 1-carboxyvinyltransferase